MRQLVLSDHASEQMNAAASRRRADFDAASQRYSQALQARADKAKAIQEKAAVAWHEGRVLAWLVVLLFRIAHFLSRTPAKPRIADAGRDEIVWEAGSEGERRVADALSRCFSDDWILVSGYRNAAGEIDKVLIGPPGLLAIEIKFVNGRVFVDGDRWWRDKYDRYGNCVESGLPIADRKGRSHSMQLNAAADRLQAFLQERSSVDRVLRAVVLSHDSSELGKVANQTVDLIATVDRVDPKALSKVMPPQGAPIDSDQIVALLRKDHEFHDRRSPRSSAQQMRPGRKGDARAAGRN